MSERYTSTKTYRNLPCAHRQWKHDGHCAYIHGYSREYTFNFDAESMDQHGWVVGFGDLKELEEYLIEMYDHTMLIAEDEYTVVIAQGLAKVVEGFFGDRSRDVEISVTEGPKEHRPRFVCDSRDETPSQLALATGDQKARHREHLRH